jgi:hypothetical protein
MSLYSKIAFCVVINFSIALSQTANAKDIFGHFIFSSAETVPVEFDSTNAVPLKQDAIKRFSRAQIAEHDFSIIPTYIESVSWTGDYATNDGEQIISENTVTGPFNNYAILLRSSFESFEGTDMRLLQRNEYSVVLRDSEYRVLELSDWKNYSCDTAVIPLVGEKRFNLYLDELASDTCPKKPSLTKNELEKAVVIHLKKNYLRQGSEQDTAVFEKWKKHWIKVIQNIDCQNKNCFSLTSVNLALQYDEDSEDENSKTWKTLKKIKIVRWQNPNVQ